MQGREGPFFLDTKKTWDGKGPFYGVGFLFVANISKGKRTGAVCDGFD